MTSSHARGEFNQTSLTTLDAAVGRARAAGLNVVLDTAGPTHDVSSWTDANYENYWGRDPMKGYSFDLGGRHIVSLPSAAYRYGCDKLGVLAWLNADLDADRKLCTLAFWQDAYWTRPTATHTRELKVKPWVQALYDHDADPILHASNHDYQRFAPQNLDDQPDRARGLRAFVLGTGGIGHYDFTGTAANLEASDATTFGALKLTLRREATTGSSSRPPAARSPTPAPATATNSNVANPRPCDTASDVDDSWVGGGGVGGVVRRGGCQIRPP